MAKEYLSKIDTALLKIEDPTNPMMITCVFMFKAPIAFERLQATIVSRLLRLDRFRQRAIVPTGGLGRPYWADDPNFDLRYHLQRAALPPPGDRAVLQDVVSLLASTPLDLSRPPWQLHMLENYEECCALVGRFHHCLVDGTALMHVVLSLTDLSPDGPWPVIEPENPYADTRESLVSRLRAARERRRVSQATRDTLKRGRFSGLLDPSRVEDLLRLSGEAAVDLGRFLVSGPDPETPLRGELGDLKRAAWSDGIPLDEIKAIRKNIGGTVNDVLLTVTAGALSRYLQDHGLVPYCLDLRVAVPMDLRPKGSEADLGNRMGAVFLALPVGIADPVARLREIEGRMNERKNSLEGAVLFVLLNLLGLFPADAATTLVKTLGTRATAVMTNVRGPQEQRYLAGSPLEGFLAWVPQTGPIGLGVSILSYAGLVRIGVLADKSLVADPETLLAAFHSEFDLLLARALEEDPAAPSDPS